MKITSFFAIAEMTDGMESILTHIDTILDDKELNQLIRTIIEEEMDSQTPCRKRVGGFRDYLDSLDN